MAHRAVFGRAGWRKKSKFYSFWSKCNIKIQYFTFQYFLLIFKGVNMIEVEILSNWVRVKGQQHMAYCINSNHERRE